MNREEAITTLKNYIERITGGMFPGEREILVEAFDALRGERDATTTSWYSKKLYCDACGKRIIGKKNNYCPMCGRKLRVGE